MWKSFLKIDLSIINMEDQAWDAFVRALRRQYRKIEVQGTREIQIQYSDRQYSEFDMRVMVMGFLSEYLDEQKPLQEEYGTSKNVRVLPMDFEPESVTYLFYSTRLTILQTIPAMREWLMQYMINLSLFYHPCYINYFFLDEEIKSMFLMQNIWYQDIPYSDIIQMTEKYLDEGIYVNIHLDEYYIPDKDNYQQRHYVHENLVYGYDADRSVFLAYGFTKRQKMKPYEITYHDFMYAFEKGRLFFFCGAKYLLQDAYAPVTLCKPKDECLKQQFKFTLTVFHDKLQEYLYPKQSEMVGEDWHVYGVHVYDYIIDELTTGNVKNTIDFRVFQLLYEQKKCIERRMQYLTTKYNMDDSWSDLVQSYQCVIQVFQKIRFLYLKQLYEEHQIQSLDGIIQDDNVVGRIVSELRRGREEERKILEKVLEMLG